MWIVRDHDDGLALLPVQGLEQVENLVSALAIQIACWLVAEQERRVAHDRARDSDALLLSAGELTGIVLGAILEPHDGECGLHVLAPLRATQVRQQQRNLDVSLGGQHGEQVVELEHEADMTGPPACELPPEAPSMRSPATSTVPSEGWSRPPIRLRSVVLPEPEGPISARKSPFGTSRLSPSSTSMRSEPRE